jgi:hypothetical protein
MRSLRTILMMASLLAAGCPLPPPSPGTDLGSAELGAPPPDLAQAPDAAGGAYGAWCTVNGMRYEATHIAFERWNDDQVHLIYSAAGGVAISLEVAHSADGFCDDVFGVGFGRDRLDGSGERDGWSAGSGRGACSFSHRSAGGPGGTLDVEIAGTLERSDPKLTSMPPSVALSCQVRRPWPG